MLVYLFVVVGCAVSVGQAAGFIVRYAALDPEPSRGYLRSKGLPMLRSSMCLSERHLTPALKEAYGLLPTYVIYTDSWTHVTVESFLHNEFAPVVGRVRLVNLDEDPEDNRRVAPFLGLGLDPINLASVRRTLADPVHLPADDARLLLGTDVSFVARPVNFMRQLKRLKRSQALYMVDDKVWNGTLYRLPAFPGPQCPGLLADFVFIGPGLRITVENMQDKLQWYAKQPISSARTEPPIRWLAEQNGSDVLYAKKHGLHAIDQFALSLALGEAVVPPGSAGCFALDSRSFLHLGLLSRSQDVMVEVEAVHDKVLSSCGLSCFDHCGLSPLMWATRDKCTADIAPSSDHMGCTFLQSSPAQKSLPGELLTHLKLTICAGERFAVCDSFRGARVLPTYRIFTNDKTCGPVSSLLEHELAHLSDRITLLNLDMTPNSRVDWIQAFVANSESGGDVFYESMRRTLANWTGLPLQSGRMILGVEMKFITHRNAWEWQELQFYSLSALHLFHVGSTELGDSWLQLYAHFASTTT